MNARVKSAKSAWLSSDTRTLSLRCMGMLFADDQTELAPKMWVDKPRKFANEIPFAEI
ncbi:MAG: hypothetical protein JSR99_02280 [Proteobacteria bacterium]|nr:hypothetical protein [Pseudomonadota bacterium]